jgi:hypothetical protein
MIPLLKSDEVKKLKLDFDGVNSLLESGSARFAGETVDTLLPSGKIRRITFGVNVIFPSRVAIVHEILRLPYEERDKPLYPKTEGKIDFIDAMLNKSFIENGWD